MSTYLASNITEEVGRDMLVFKPQIICLAATTTVAIFSYLILAGWVLDIGYLRFLLPARQALSGPAAMSFLIAALSLFLLQKSRGQRQVRFAARLFLLVPFLLSTPALLKHIVSLAGENEQSALLSALSRLGSLPVLATSADVSFISTMLVLAILCLHIRSGQLDPASKIFAGLSMITGCAWIVTLSMGLEPNLTMPGGTVLMFMLMVIAIFAARPEQESTSRVWAAKFGSLLASRPIPACVGALLALGRSRGMVQPWSMTNSH